MIVSLKQALAKVMAVVVVVTLTVTFLLAGAQCVEKKPAEKLLELPAEGPVVIAAQDSPADVKAQADFICDGTGDSVEIQAVIDAVSERGGGEVVLTEGTFYPNGHIYVRPDVTLRGQGYDTSLITGDIRVKTATDVVVSDLRIDAAGGGYAIAVIDLSKRVTVENCWAFNATDDEITVVHGCEDVIIRNCTVEGKYGGYGRANIEVGDEAKRVTVSNCTLLGGHKDRMGITANWHRGEWEPAEDLQIIGNIIDGVQTDAMRLSAIRVNISDNTLSNIGEHGIRTMRIEGWEDITTSYTITNNVVRNVNGSGIYAAGDNVTITGNQIIGGGSILVGQACDSVMISNNTLQGAQGEGIKVSANNNMLTIGNNNIESDGGGIVIDAPVTEVTIVNNRVFDPGDNALTLGRIAKTGEVINRVTIKDNDFGNSSSSWLQLAAIISNLEADPPYDDSIVDAFDSFKGALAASTNHVSEAVAGAGAEQEITYDITNPDLPRNISITATNNAAPSGYVRVEGTNARGDADSEEIAIIAGDTACGNKAFATITKVTIPAGVSPADTVEVGISEKLGLSHPISAASDVYMVEGTLIFVYQKIEPRVDVANGTVDFNPIQADPDPDWPNLRVWYKTHLTSD